MNQPKKKTSPLRHLTGTIDDYLPQLRKIATNHNLKLTTLKDLEKAVRIYIADSKPLFIGVRNMVKLDCRKMPVKDYMKTAFWAGELLIKTDHYNDELPAAMRFQNLPTSTQAQILRRYLTNAVQNN